MAYWLEIGKTSFYHTLLRDAKHGITNVFRIAIYSAIRNTSLRHLTINSLVKDILTTKLNRK